MVRVCKFPMFLLNHPRLVYKRSDYAVLTIRHNAKYAGIKVGSYVDIFQSLKGAFSASYVCPVKTNWDIWVLIKHMSLDRIHRWLQIISGVCYRHRYAS